TPSGRPKTSMPSSLPLLFPAGNLTRKTPVMNDPVFGDQSTKPPEQTQNWIKLGGKVKNVEALIAAG
ncbi:hypothetical protein, partial [Rhizobium daejeonense]|uniref:hypothetical protein n=1 Tax=Rhizobium daejeonense TaxID=240521 RepID=UPI0019D51987